MIDQSSFCPAPWMGVFYHTNSARVCCTSKEIVPGSITNFKNSDHINSLKEDFLNGRRPPSCQDCWELEDQGLKSMRNTVFFSFVPESEFATFNKQTKRDVEYLELRGSNLCNFSCRMCHPIDSNQLGNEIKNLPHLNTLLYRNSRTVDLEEITTNNFQEIIDQISTVRYLHLTGGEPMLIKQYYNLIDYIINHGYHKNMSLQITTNCSVYNSQIVDRITKFKRLRLTLSLDAVAEVAEYQRHGTKWDTIKSNIINYVQLPNVEIIVNTTVTAYTVLDLSNLVDFLLELQKLKNNADFVLRVTNGPAGFSIASLNKDLRTRAITQITESIEKVKHIKNFKWFVQECVTSLDILNGAEDADKFNTFVQKTVTFDSLRNESFEKTFGYQLPGKQK
jgi:molybdenum cofactor biosynthesis enzyme MoaA